MYVTMYGMHRTTVHLPDDLKASLARAAAAEGRSEAELIREGVQLVTVGHPAAPPSLPLFSSDDPTLAERVDEALEGFGES